MSETIGTAKVEFLREDHRFVRFLEAFRFYSDVLGCWNVIPYGFICDLESVPLLRGTNPEAGGIHDLVCRKDFLPAINAITAARVYIEFQRYYDAMEKEKYEALNWFNHSWDWIRQEFKTGVVIAATPTYWHKFNINATYEELSGIKESEG